MEKHANYYISHKLTPPPRVSVVITCYNYGRFLASCLNSVLTQTFSDLEVILIDDGSTDNSKDIATSFLDDKRFRYIRQSNGGQANAKNRGIQEATGTLIAFLDADDTWNPRKLEKQIPLFDDPLVGVVYARQSFIDESGNPVETGPRPKTLRPFRGNVTKSLFIDNFIPFSSTIVRSYCFNEFNGFDESLPMGIDWDLWLRLSTRYCFEYIDAPLLISRIGHSDQMSKNTLTRHQCSDRIMAMFKKNYPEAVPAYLERKAYAFTYCNRGAYFRRDDNVPLSTQHYLQALRYHPLWVAAYKGLLRNAFSIITKNNR
ncbi:glycosyltransferase family 2 protein [Desulfosediminicola ganghwensis]|uniref:glycosyltransferase family 2 protein n=1 Tax=Desulfosediminicola ganghwensis TaxID=2569540 RepID=UPI0010AB66DC|nr:glycosyltransferase [Desulfosediminicola ganghwensis]